MSMWLPSWQSLVNIELSNAITDINLTSTEEEQYSTLTIAIGRLCLQEGGGGGCLVELLRKLEQGLSELQIGYKAKTIGGGMGGLGLGEGGGGFRLRIKLKLRHEQKYLKD